MRPPPIRPCGARHQAHHRQRGHRLAAAGLAHQRQRLARRQRERHVIDRGMPRAADAELGPQVFDAQHIVPIVCQREILPQRVDAPPQSKVCAGQMAHNRPRWESQTVCAAPKPFRSRASGGRAFLQTRVDMVLCDRTIGLVPAACPTSPGMESFMDAMNLVKFGTTALIRLFRPSCDRRRSSPALSSTPAPNQDPHSLKHNL